MPFSFASFEGRLTGGALVGGPRRLGGYHVLTAIHHHNLHSRTHHVAYLRELKRAPVLVGVVRYSIRFDDATAWATAKENTGQLPNTQILRFQPPSFVSQLIKATRLPSCPFLTTPSFHPRCGSGLLLLLAMS